MTDPIRVSIFFDTQGNAQLQRGAEDVDRLSRRISAFVAQTNGLPSALRAAERSLNQFGVQQARAADQVIHLLTGRVDALTSALGRLAGGAFSRYGFLSIVAGAGAAGYALKGLLGEFLKVNEKFADLEILIASAFNSRSVGRQVRNQLAEITVTSPVPYQGLGDAARSLALMPQLSRQVGKQAATGTLGESAGFFRQYIQLVEQLLVLRPDKEVKDATFAIREAATGELRSLIRRFDFPAQLLVNASGRSLEELKRDPVEMVGAIKKALNRVVTPQAIREISLQPTKVFQNIAEQLKDIPLLGVGDAGFYNKILRSLDSFFKDATNFVKNSFPKYGQRLSDALSSAFDSTLSLGKRGFDGLLDLFGQNGPSVAGLSRFEKFAEGAIAVVNVLEKKLPSAISTVIDFVKKVKPIFEAIFGVITTAISSIAEKFVRNPGWTSLLIFLGTQLPKALGLGLSLISDRVIAMTQSVRLALVSPALGQASFGIAGQTGMLRSAVSGPGLGLNPFQTYTTQTAYANQAGGATVNRYFSSGANLRALSANEAALVAAGGVATGAPGVYRVPVPSAARFAGVRGATYTANAYTGATSLPAAVAAILASRGITPALNPLAGQQINLPGYFDDRVNRRTLNEYGIGRNASGQMVYTAGNVFGARPGSFFRPGVSSLPPGVIERTSYAQQLTLARAEGGFGARVAASAGLTALGAGASVGTANAIAGTAGGIASIATGVVIPIIAVVASSYILGEIVSKVRTYISDKQIAEKKSFAEKRNLTTDSLELNLRELQARSNLFGSLKRLPSDNPDRLTLERQSLGLSVPSVRKQLKYAGDAVYEDLIPDGTKPKTFSVKDISSELENLASDYEKLGRQLLDRSTSSFEEFKLKSNPSIEVKPNTAFAIFDSLAKALQESVGSVDAFNKALDTTGKRPPGFLLEQVLSQAQEDLLAQLQDATATFGSRQQGISTAIASETTTKLDPQTGRKTEVPTAFSGLAGRLGAIKESEEAAQLTSDSADQLRKLTLILDPFSTFKKVFDEDLKRIAELTEISQEFNTKLQNGTLGIGIPSADKLQKLIEDATKSGLKFDYSELTSVVADLRSGSNSSKLNTVIQDFLGRYDDATYSGLSSRLTQFLATFATSIEALPQAGDTADFEKGVRNLRSQTESLFKQFTARGFKFDAQSEEVASLVDSLSSPYKLPTDLQDTARLANSKIMTALGKSLEGTIDEAVLEIDGKGVSTSAAGLDNIQNQMDTVLKTIALSVTRYVTGLSERYTRAIEAHQDDVARDTLAGNINNSNRFDVEYSAHRFAALQASVTLGRLGAGKVPPELASLLETGSSGSRPDSFYNQVKLQRTLVTANSQEARAAKAKFEQAEKAGPNGNPADVEFYLRQWALSVKNASAAMDSVTKLLTSSEQRQAFSSLFAPRQNSNVYDRQLLAADVGKADVFSNVFGGETPRSRILELQTTSGLKQTTNQLAQLKEMELVASRNASAFKELALSEEDALNFADASAYRTLSQQMLELASKAREAQEAITGKGGIFNSFTSGFTSLTDQWKNTAQNFLEIGRGLADGLSSSLSGSFSSFIMGAKTASEAIQDFGKNFLNTAVNLLTQKAIQSLLGFAFSGFGGVGGIVGNVAASAAPAPSAWNMDGSIARASGGLIPGHPSYHDNVVAKLSSGEFVIPTHAVQKFGADHFESYRMGQMPGYATGGHVGPRYSPHTPQVPMSEGSAGVYAPINVNVEVKDGNATTSVEAQGKLGKEIGVMLKAMVDERLVLALRQGGIVANRKA